MKCLVILVLAAMLSCNYTTFTPRSKRNIQKETPSVLIFDKIVDFRIEQMSWPTSITDFKSKGIKYFYAFDDFPYNKTEYNIIDSNNMTFYFFDHKKIGKIMKKLKR